MANFWHRSSGDLNDVLIDPAEDWSQAKSFRDHFRSRELLFNLFLKLNFEIAARGRAGPAGRKSKFSKIVKKPIWTHHPT